MDVVLIALSLGALAENTSGVMVVRLIRVMRVNVPLHYDLESWEVIGLTCELGRRLFGYSESCNP